MVSEGGHYDVLYVYKLFGIEEHPFHWIPLDFASMLFSHGISPVIDDLAEQLGLDRRRFRPHHALDDARFLREIYLRVAQGQP
jgi:hypothetical protein